MTLHFTSQATLSQKKTSTSKLFNCCKFILLYPCYKKFVLFVILSTKKNKKYIVSSSPLLFYIYSQHRIKRKTKKNSNIPPPQNPLPVDIVIPNEIPLKTFKYQTLLHLHCINSLLLQNHHPPQ